MYVHKINPEEFVFLASNFNDWNYNTMTEIKHIICILTAFKKKFKISNFNDWNYNTMTDRR